MSHNNSLLSSNARIQVPWVKVTLVGSDGEYTFGIFSNKSKKAGSDGKFYSKAQYDVRYPNYIESLEVIKINGQVNQYTLNIVYPITQNDDPNFFEKLFSSVSQTRKIVFTYGDAAVPSFVYKDEEAIITTISQNFSLESSTISYTVKAISSAALTTPVSLSFGARTGKPSDIIKEIFNTYNLGNTFTGMSSKDLSSLIAGNDASVTIEAKTNISALDYLSYLVSCMSPAGSGNSNNSGSIYVLTIHDESIYDSQYTYNENFGDSVSQGSHTGPYFKVSQVSYNTEKSDAYEIDIGYNTSTIVTQFSIENNENYSLYYEHQMEIAPDTYVRRIGDDGKWEDVYAPTVSSKNNEYLTTPKDKTWWTKITQFPINASITVQGLLRPAQLLTYVRLNVIFPGGHKHISSGLYIITKQIDRINGNGYRTELSLTKIGGAENLVSEASSSTETKKVNVTSNTGKSSTYYNKVALK